MAISEEMESRIYIYGNKRNQVYTFVGLQFKEFFETLNTLPQNMLLLKHNYDQYETNYYTGFDFVDVHGMKNLKEEAEKFEKFCWVDFQDVSLLEELEPRNIADLLYFAHKKEPIEGPFSSHLNNRFAYVAENGVTRIYFRKSFDVMNLISKTIQKRIATTNRRKLLFFQKATQMSTVPFDVIENLLPLIDEGIIIDFHEKVDNRKEIVVPFYVLQSENEYEDHFFHMPLDELNMVHFGDLIYLKKEDTWTMKYF